MYTACLNLEGKKVTIVGGGKIAYRKAMAFCKEECEVHVIAPCFIPEFKALGHDVNLIYKYYEEGDCANSFLVVAATNDQKTNYAIGLFCKRANKLCNVVDNKELSSFIVPSTFKRGDLVIAVSTGGASPSLAARIKQELEEKYDASYEELIQIHGRLRSKVLEKVADEGEKKKILNHLAMLDIKELKAYEKSYFGC
ncbi:MAG: bifunctional precorrin-2 dehydrogenase/sirohydrochlorin ferrochelatase [Niameybacter sp.]|uniref:precorrin-2 dehydrogenase/sirohydrochlorin ferrochelatase family protein n=1 Tax=Niameybacter sp. TaxID=2033640 RepID=UPI002FC6094B